MKAYESTNVVRLPCTGGSVATACTVLLLLFSLDVRAAERQVVYGHVPVEVKSLQPLGRFPGTNLLHLAIGLPLRNREALSNLLEQIYDPNSPNYHHYLTPEQFTDRFGATEKDYAAVMAFARAKGLHVTATHPNRLLVDVEGSVADIEQALHVTLREYRHPREQRLFHAPDSEPTLDLTTPVLSISGLDDYSLPRPRLEARRLTDVPKASPNAGSGPGGTYMGKDFRAAYVPDTSRDGSGQVVGLLQFDGYTASDIAYYESQAGLPSVTLSNVLIDGASGGPSGSGGEVEVSLDIEMAISMATNLSAVMVYMAPNPSPFEDILNRMVEDNVAKQLSCSWYVPYGAAEPAADQIFQEMAMQGQSFFNASGDDDAYTGLIDFPGDTPYITQVGGTTLTTSGPGGAWMSETVWNRGNGIGSGGGISTQYGIPGWQTNISMVANGGSTTMRNTPDVALTAENVYVRADGINYTVGGTSCAAPLWAGFCALVNQQAVATGATPVGFINPLVDAIGTGANYTSAFHDITTGNNTSPSSPSRFYAVSGFDLCTGWGTPAGQKLINALANPEALVITPASGFSSIGGVGGPFTVTTQSLSLTNVGTNTLTWTLVNTSLWLNTTLSGGTLTPGGPATTVTAGLNTAASNLVVGTYSATLWFTNLNSGAGQSRQYNLSVISPPTITLQPTDQAVLEGASAVFTVGVAGGQPMYYQWQANGTNLADGGTISGSTTTNLVISEVTAADAGAYSIVVSNIAGVAVSSNASLKITPSQPVIVGQPTNQTVVAGTTAHFKVTVYGNTPLFYQWTFEGTNIDGATSAALTLTNAQFSDAGNYAVLITNTLGSVLSSNAILRVIPCDPPPSGLVGWWPGEGTAQDIVSGSNGTIYPGTTISVGMVGQAFNFDGVSGCVMNTNTPPLTNIQNSFTMEFWTYPKKGIVIPPQNNIGYPGISGQSYAIFPDWGGYNGPAGAGVSVGTNGIAVLEHAAGYLPSMLSYTNTINGWTHIAVVYSNKQPVLYVNGIKVGTGITSAQSFVYPSKNLGNEYTAGFSFQSYGPYQGLLDEISIYNRALSSNEIAAIYIAGSGGKCFTPTPPQIATQPTNQSVAAGQTAIFAIGANGTPPLSYQWSFNGTNLTGATGPTLTLTNVEFNQAGIYAVVVANAYGSAASSNAMLTVFGIPPSISSQPANQTAILGMSATFSVAASGTPPLSYQWEFNGTNLLGATNTTLTLTNLQLTQAGNYDVLVTNYYGSLFSSNAILTVYPPPFNCAPVPSGLVAWWPAEGNAQDIVSGSNGTIYLGTTFAGGMVGQAFNFDGVSGCVMNTNTPPLTNIQNSFTMEFWTYPQKGFTMLPEGGGLGNSGQSYAIFPDWGGSDGPAGAGVCAGTNGITVMEHADNYLPSVLSYTNPIFGWTHIAVVYLNKKPTLYVNGVNVRTGLTSTRTYVYPSKNLGSSYAGARGFQFQYYGPYGGLLDEISIYNRALSAAEIQAIYAAGSGGKCSPSPTPPVIIAQPTNQTIVVGGTAMFVVGAGGTPPLRYQWNFKGTTISDATNATLMLTNVLFSQAGNYGVLVTNFYGATNSANAQLTVTLSPTNCDPPPFGLVNWWPAEGNAQDIVSGSNGTIYPGTTFSAGMVGQTFNFDGVSGCVMNTNTPPLTNIQNSFTMEFWAYPRKGIILSAESTSGYPGISGQSYAVFPDWGGNNAGNVGPAGVGVSVGSNGIAVMEHAAGLLASLLSYTNVITGWTHIAVVCSNKQPVLYVNGGRVRTGITSSQSLVYPSKNLGNEYMAGFSFQSYGPYQGLLDEISIYNRALSSNEIAAIYSAGNGGKCLPQPPMIFLQPTNQSVKIGSTINFGVTAIGTPPLSYQWKLNGTNILGATDAILTLTNVQLTDSGNYSVLVTNVYGSIISSNAVLVVGLPPTISVQPASQAVALGCDATFNVSAKGDEPLSYQWEFSGTNVIGATNASLTLTDIRTSDFGRYQVVVANLFGSMTSSPALLTLGHPPVAGADTIYRFAAGGVRVNASILLANDTDVDGDSLTIIEVSSSSSAGGTVGLTNNWIYYAPPNGVTFDTFAYVVSDGHCGSDVGVVTVQVRPDNPQPVTFAVANPGDASIRLTFDGIPGYAYRLEYTEGLSNPTWQTLATQTADGFGVCQFEDGALTNTPMRFYRAVWP